MSKRKRKRKPTGKKCIYFAHCGNEADSVEHAIPENLMPQRSREIILEEHICEECNNGICAKLDEKVIRQSYLGYIHQDFETFEDRGSASFHYKFHHDFPPLRFLGVLESGDFALMVPAGFTTENEETILVKIAASYMPSHLIVTRHNKTDSDVDILDKNSNLKSSDFCYSERDVYRVQDRIVVFGPTALKGYHDKREDRYKRGYYYKPDEFIQKFLTSVDGETFRVSYVPPDPDDPVRSQADRFMEFLDNTGRRTELAPFDESAFQIRDVLELGPDTNRGIAKIAFHCFLYKYQAWYDSRDGMFDRIKAFIYNGDYKNDILVDERPPYDKYPSSGKHGAVRPGSNERCYIEHIFDFYANGENIICVCEFYVGTQESLIFTVILSGCDKNELPMHWLGDLRVPYEVSREHPRIKRILRPTCEETEAVADSNYPGYPRTRLHRPTDTVIRAARVGDLSSNSAYERLRYRLRRR